MTSAEKVAQLRALLCDTLLPLINNDYIFLDIPYYSNPGDTLISVSYTHLTLPTIYSV